MRRALYYKYAPEVDIQDWPGEFYVGPWWAHAATWLCEQIADHAWQWKWALEGRYLKPEDADGFDRTKEHTEHFGAPGDGVASS